MAARTLICARCGGAVPLSALGASAACPYCRAELRLSPAELAELAQYQAHVGSQLEQAQRELGHAASWDRWYGGKEARRRNHPLIAVGIWLTLVVLLGGVSFLAQALRLPGEVMAKVMPIAVFGALFAVIGGYMLWYYLGRSREEKASRVGATQVACPQCGAPNAFWPGQVLERCRFCSSPLLPSAQAQQLGRAEAERALFVAELERHRAERRGMAGLSSMSAANTTPYIVLGSFLPMTGFGALFATYSFLFESEKDAPLLAVLLMWAMALANAGLLALVFLFRRARREKWQALVSAQVRTLGGAFLPDLDAINAWLDRHWAGPVPFQQLFRGPCFLGAHFEVEGLPVLLVCNPVGASEHYPGFVVVRVGAWLGDARAHPALANARSALDAQGFRVELERAGVVALADAKRARRLVREAPSGLTHVIAAAARAAREAGATAVREG